MIDERRLAPPDDIIFLVLTILTTFAGDVMCMPFKITCPVPSSGSGIPIPFLSRMSQPHPFDAAYMIAVKVLITAPL